MNHPNIRLLERAAQQLMPLLDKLVFVGGSITGLLITDPAAAPVRSTKDVDTIVEITTRAAYYKLAEELRELGFKEDVSPDAPTCRWLHTETILDVMPTDATCSDSATVGTNWHCKKRSSSRLEARKSKSSKHPCSWRQNSRHSTAEAKTICSATIWKMSSLWWMVEQNFGRKS
jgi:hypothetical protein